MATLEFDNVSKRYRDGHLAVDSLSMTVSDGELMILVGPSGCGKSSALRMVAGLEEISGGELRIGDQVVNGLPPKVRDVAMVFQNYALYPHMSVRENMGFSLRLARSSRSEIDARVAEAAALLDLTEHLDRKPASLSGGQRQRVAMGRALVRNPQVFLMDEPLSNLDAKPRVQMRASIARLQQRLGTTMLYVTHDQTEAMTLGDRVAVLRSGILQQVDVPSTLYDAPANVFVAGFIGSPAMNLFEGTIEDAQIRTEVGDFALPDGLAIGADRNLIVGVRPEHFDDAELTANSPTAIEVTIELVESVGSETYAYFLRPGRRLPERIAMLAGEAIASDVPGEESGLGVARLHPDSRVKAGARARLAVDPGKLHLFDATTGERVGPATARRPVASAAG